MAAPAASSSASSALHLSEGIQHDSRLGNAEAQCKVADCLMQTSSPGERPNYALAAQWYERAAKQGFADAQFKLAQILRTGDRCLPADPLKAFDLYSAAAQQHHPAALFEMGFVYYNGALGQRPDFSKAFEYFSHPAAAQYELAQYQLFVLLMDLAYDPSSDAGLDHDEMRARHWLCRAAAKGHSEAQELLEQG